MNTHLRLLLLFPRPFFNLAYPARLYIRSYFTGCFAAGLETASVSTAPFITLIKEWAFGGAASFIGHVEGHDGARVSGAGVGIAHTDAGAGARADGRRSPLVHVNLRLSHMSRRRKVQVISITTSAIIITTTPTITNAATGATTITTTITTITAAAATHDAYGWGPGKRSRGHPATDGSIQSLAHRCGGGGGG